MSAVEKHDSSVKSGDKNPDAATPGHGSEPEVTPLPAPMPGLSMELEALEPEEPSLAPLAKLPGVVARAGSAGGKKAKVTASPAGKSATATKVASKAAGKQSSAEKSAVKAKPATASAPASASPVATATATLAAPAIAPAVLTTKPPALLLRVPEPLIVATPAIAPRTNERSRAWWAIGALGLVALGAGAGALLWQPTPTAPTAPSEQPAPVTAAAPRAALTVTPIEAPANAPALPAPIPIVEALPMPAAPMAKPTAASKPAAHEPSAAAIAKAGPAATKPTTSEPALLAPRTTSRPTATPTPTATVAAKPSGEAKPGEAKPGEAKPGEAKPGGKAPAKVAGKPVAAIAAAPLPMEPVPQLSPPIIRQHMLVAEKRFPTCVREGFGSNVSIGIVVEASGSVRKADILGPLGQSATGRCISDQIRGLRFPAFTDGGATKFFVWSYQVPQAN